jgi:RNA polymerase sigma-70 factor (ECF subfamily)
VPDADPIDPGATRELLLRWHGGDASAIADLLRRDLPWICAQVRQRLGARLRQLGDTDDYVQEVVVDFLRHGPRLLLSDRQQLRAFLARVAANVLVDQHHFHHAQRRDVRRAEPLPSETVLELDAGTAITRPSEAAARNEERAWIRIALELLGAEDRQVIVLRDWQELGFSEIGGQLGLTEAAARMRYVRALPRLAQTVRQLQERRFGDLLQQDLHEGEDRS